MRIGESRRDGVYGKIIRWQDGQSDKIRQAISPSPSVQNVERAMVDIVAAIQTSIEVVKKLRELSTKVDNAEFKMLLADLSSELGDAKLEAANLKVELAE